MTRRDYKTAHRKLRHQRECADILKSYCLAYKRDMAHASIKSTFVMGAMKHFIEALDTQVMNYSNIMWQLEKEMRDVRYAK